MTNIKNWAKDDRPREKLILKGAATLSAAELLAIIIGSGDGKRSAVDLARDILYECDSDLLKIAQIHPSALMRRFKGIGQAKAASIAACLELGKRTRKTPTQSIKRICSCADAVKIFSEDLSEASFECFQMLLLTNNHNVLRKVTVSEGGLNRTTVDPKKIFKIALDERASAIIFAHNHPSGFLLPSEQDITTTSRLVKAGKMLEINVIDHIIIGGDDYFSFSESGLIASTN
jgi:DNA repair protein RadC